MSWKSIVAASAVALMGGAGIALPVQADETITYTYDSLGRLVIVKSSGDVNNGETHSLCYDPAGNREQYLSTSNSSSASCPTPPAPNSPPVLVNTTDNILCGSTKTYDVISGASDPESNTPLVFTGIVFIDGFSAATVVSSSEIEVVGESTEGTTEITYAVEDSLGDASTGVLTINTSGPPNQCDSGGVGS